MSVDVSVIIPHLNQPELLEKCLEALQEQSLDPARFEVIVVDNGSGIPPESLVARFPGFRLVRETTPGPGPARNLGAAVSSAPLLAFTDADCMPDRGWLAAILSRFAGDPKLEILGGDVRIFTDDPDDVTPAEAFQILYAFRQELSIRRHNLSVTANLVISRAVFDEVGPFAGIDTAEDMDWCKRATHLGHRIVYAPEVFVLHPARNTMADLRGIWDRYVTHFYRYRARGAAGKLKWALTIPLMAASPLAEIPTILGSHEVSGMRMRWRVFSGLAQIRLYRAFRMAAVMVGGSDGTTRWNRG